MTNDSLTLPPDQELERHQRYERLSDADRRFLEQLKSQPMLGTLPVAEERARMRTGQCTVLTDYPVTLQRFESSACPIHLIRPQGASAPAPVLFFLHGGGWMLGELQTHIRLVCELAVRTGCVVAFVEYPRAPEHPYPAPLQASLTAVREVLQDAKSLALDAERFVVAGDSSGGNLTAALVLGLIEQKLPMPVCQVLLYPVTDYSWMTPSYREYKDNPNLSQAAMQWFWKNYLQGKTDGAGTDVSPLRATDELLAKSPPTLVITCEYDVLRDEGEAFAGRLSAAGVEVAAVRWLGSLHGFLVTESLSGSTSAKACLDLIAQYIQVHVDADMGMPALGASGTLHRV